MSRCVALFVVLCTASTGIRAATIVVRPPTTSGSDATSGFTDLQAAVDAAQDGDTVLLEPGTYVLSEPLDFNSGVSDSTPSKNITLRSVAGPKATLLQREESAPLYQRGPVVRFDSGETEASVIEGVTVTRGAGIHVIGSSPRLINCVVTRNTGQEGGGVLCRGDAAPRFERCTISANTANCGGGIFSEGESQPHFSRTEIVGNEACCDGGGGVTATQGSAPEFVNCVIAANFSDDGGAAALCVEAAPVFLNCTIADNHHDSQVSGGIVVSGGSVSITNSILAQNSGANLEVYDGASANVSFSIVEAAEVHPGEGNMRFAPRFLRAGFFDFRSFTSEGLPNFVARPADYHVILGADGGTSLGAPDVDFDGNGRPCGRGVDIGAFESGECAPAIQFRRGDVNDDGRLSISDPIFLWRFLFSFGDQPPCLDAADADDGGWLDVNDGIFTLNFMFRRGPPPPEPFARCGKELTPDDVPCSGFSACL